MSGSPSERDVEFWRRSAIGAAENPLAWRGRAEALWRAAEALLAIHEADIQEHYALLTDASARARNIGAPRQEPVANVYMMLAGLALEALVKGYIVATDPNAITSQHGQTALRPKWGGKHVGVPLVALANLPTSPAGMSSSTGSDCSSAGVADTRSRRTLRSCDTATLISHQRRGRATMFR
jgi:hypothetical protein